MYCVPTPEGNILCSHETGKKTHQRRYFTLERDLRGIGSIHDEMKKKSTYAKQDYVEAKKEA